MQVRLGVLGLVVVSCLTGLGRAGITVTSYQTVAGTNAFAPLSQAEYFQQQILTNVSPAVADVAGDWTGTNVGGTETTWHWIGAAHASTTTAFDCSSLTITADASFSWDISTTADFYDPGRVLSLYEPGSGANEQCHFSLDGPATYNLSVQLNRLSSVSLRSSAGQIVSRLNTGTGPVIVTSDGTLPAGDYQITIGTGLAGLGFIQGANHEVESGSFSDFMFSVQVPEPINAAIGPFVALLLLQRVPRRT